MSLRSILVYFAAEFLTMSTNPITYFISMCCYYCNLIKRELRHTKIIKEFSSFIKVFYMSFVPMLINFEGIEPIIAVNACLFSL